MAAAGDPAVAQGGGIVSTKQKRSGKARGVVLVGMPARPEQTVTAPPPLASRRVVTTRHYVIDDAMADLPCPYGTVPFSAPATVPHELCEFCQLSLTDARSAFETQNVGTEAKPATIRTTRKLPLTTLKPRGQPCWRCGHDDPPGSHPWRWDVRARFGDGHDGQPFQTICYKGEG